MSHVNWWFRTTFYNLLPSRHPTLYWPTCQRGMVVTGTPDLVSRLGDLLAVSIASATAAAAAATATSAKAKAYARAAVRAAKAASALADNAGKPRGARPLALRPAANPRASLTFGPTCVHKPKRKRSYQRRPTPGYLTVFLVPEDSIPRLQ